MFNLIRRISASVIPRPDRPWEDDPTSNAPARNRKRRMSSTERHMDVEDEQSRKKKMRSETATPDVEEEPFSPQPQPETEAVKEVTEGVKEVELDDKLNPETAPETVPLPEEKSGELEEPASGDATTTEPAAESTSTSDHIEGSVPESNNELSDDSAEEPTSTAEGEKVAQLSEAVDETTGVPAEVTETKTDLKE